MSDLIERARDFAIDAHGDQIRKYVDEPYWFHCRRVAEMVERRTVGIFKCENMIAAAWLHDVLEDTDVTDVLLFREFDLPIWWMVNELTDKFTPEKYPHLNRARRKELECERMQYVKEETKLIKLCDLIDNTASIVEHDPKFAITYLREKANLLEAMGFGQ